MFEFLSQHWVLAGTMALFYAWLIWMLCRTLWKYWLKNTLLKSYFAKRIPRLQKIPGTLEQSHKTFWKKLTNHPAIQPFNHAFSRTYRKYTPQLPDTLDALSNAMQAGYSFPQALIFVERESLPPIKHLLKKAVEELNYNFSVETVLGNIDSRAKNRDVSLVCEGLLMQLRIGGNLAEMMKNEAHIIRERLALEKDIQAATSQGRLSGLIIAFLWPISALLFLYISPEYIGILFYSTQGQKLLLIGLILELIGFYMIWKITTVKI